MHICVHGSNDRVASSEYLLTTAGFGNLVGTPPWLMADYTALDVALRTFVTLARDSFFIE